MAGNDFGPLSRQFVGDEPALLASRKRAHELEMDSPRKRRREDVVDLEGKDNAYALSPLLNRGDIIPCNTVMMYDTFQNSPDLHMASSNLKGETTPGGSARKAGRVVGAKGYSLQEIQLLFTLIHEKVGLACCWWILLGVSPVIFLTHLLSSAAC
jgi:hypothetical protein